MTQIILGSQSPRRQEILGYFGIPFKQVSPDFDEEAIEFYDEPEKFVCQLSKGKADSLKERYPDAVIITADTIVYRSGKIFGKPKDIEEAFQFLSELSGQWHTVYTGVTVRYGEKEVNRAEATKVLFNALNADQIRHYHGMICWADKAGGFAIQKEGGLIIRKIEGCYYNVMGLPINTVNDLLNMIGIDLWNPQASLLERV